MSSYVRHGTWTTTCSEGKNVWYNSGKIIAFYTPTVALKLSTDKLCKRMPATTPGYSPIEHSFLCVWQLDDSTLVNRKSKAVTWSTLTWISRQLNSWKFFGTHGVLLFKDGTTYFIAIMSSILAWGQCWTLCNVRNSAVSMSCKDANLRVVYTFHTVVNLSKPIALLWRLYLSVCKCSHDRKVRALFVPKTSFDSLRPGPCFSVWRLANHVHRKGCSSDTAARTSLFSRFTTSDIGWVWSDGGSSSKHYQNFGYVHLAYRSLGTGSVACVPCPFRPGD